MACGQSGEITVWARANHHIGADAPDRPCDVASQRKVRGNPAVFMAEELYVHDANCSPSLGLFSSPDASYGVAWRGRIKSTGIAIGDDDVAHLDSERGEDRNGSRGPKINVIRVCRNDKNPLEFHQGHNHDIKDNRVVLVAS
jgi:hypothetical protein